MSHKCGGHHIIDSGASYWPRVKYVGVGGSFENYRSPHAKARPPVNSARVDRFAEEVRHGATTNVNAETYRAGESESL